MNILFDAKVLNMEYTGIAKTIIFLFEACHKIDESFMAYGFGSTKNDKHAYIDKGIILLSGKSRKELKRYIEKFNIDAIHYPYNKGGYLRFCNKPQILTIYDLIPLEEDLFDNRFEKMKYIFEKKISIKNANVVITSSEYVRHSLIDFTNGKIDPQVIYWGVTLPLDSESKKKLEFNYFLYVGGYHIRKGIDRLVKAFTTMYKEGGTKSKLVIVGKQRTINHEVDELIREGVKNGSIIQTWYIKDEEVCNLYKNAICTVYLSQAEGFGLPLIEAMRFGCPVVSTKNTSLEEIGGDACYYVDRNNIPEIVGAMKTFEKDQNTRKYYIEAGYKNVEKYKWDIAATRYLNIISELTNNKSK